MSAQPTVQPIIQRKALLPAPIMRTGPISTHCQTNLFG
jgi:hypothetical protein